MSETNDERCETCRFMVERKRTFHECRRLPPIRLSAFESTWPMVYLDNWCGEYQPRGTTK